MIDKEIINFNLTLLMTFLVVLIEKGKVTVAAAQQPNLHSPVLELYAGMVLPLVHLASNLVETVSRLVF